MYIYCVYPENWKYSKTIVKFSVILIIFNGVFYHIHTYPVTISYMSLCINQVPEKLYFGH
jgi:hypothetical protein